MSITIGFYARDLNLLIKNLTKEDKNGCFIWQASIGKPGYGTFRMHSKYYNAHRWVAHLAYNVPYDDPRVVMHSCDNRACVNPAHLSWGTQKENLNDARAKGHYNKSPQMICKNGHLLTPDNIQPSPDGRRRCKKCYIARYTASNSRRG